MGPTVPRDHPGLIDGELAAERRARPVKTRRRGVSAGELLVSLAECQLVGGAFFDHLEDLRADSAGAAVRAVGDVPSAPAALQVTIALRLLALAAALWHNQLIGQPGRHLAPYNH